MKDKIKKVISKFKIVHYDKELNRWQYSQLHDTLSSSVIDELTNKILKITKGK